MILRGGTSIKIAFQFPPYPLHGRYFPQQNGSRPQRLQGSRRCLDDAMDRPNRDPRITRYPTDAEAIFAGGQYLIPDGVGDVGPSKRLTVRSSLSIRFLHEGTDACWIA